MPYYNLVRDETQDLFKLGKELKTNTDVDPEILHQNLYNLTHKSPKLSIKQMAWWLNILRKYNIERPDWLVEASLDAIFVDGEK